jgi:twitching motility protein PilT
MTSVNDLLKKAVELKASDLHLSSGVAPIVRVDGDLITLDGEAVLTNEFLQKELGDIRPKIGSEKFEQDFSYEIKGLSRFRVNIFIQTRGISAVFRVIPDEAVTLEELMMPPIMKELCELSHGLVLITGPTGSGKSTTLAAMVHHINTTQSKHLLTLEDPIEFTHKSEKCLVQQREVHQHTESFSDALRAMLREDPDVILIGEMRDLETVRLALTAAETGHLVFATLHTNTAPTTINRIIDVFPAGEKDLVRSMLAESLRAVMSQTLLKRIGGGRVAAYEILISTPAVRNLIREDKIPQILSAIQTGQEKGMKTLGQHLKELAEQGLIEPVLERTKAKCPGT